jgi:MSHA biogenesis protein MshI
MLPLLRGKKAQGWMGVVRTEGRIDLAHVVRPSGERPEIRLLDSFAMEKGESDALERLRTARNLKSYRCTTLLADGNYRLLQIDAPTVPDDEKVQAARWRLKDMVDFPVENAAIGLLDIPLKDGGAGRQPMAFAVISPAQAVGERMRLFDGAKVPLEAIEVPELAQRNVAALFEDPNRGLAFLNLANGDGLLTITYNSELYLARRIDVSAKAMADADPERRQMLIERLVIELQRTMDTFDRQFNFISVARLVVATECEVEGLMAALAENLYVPAQAMDLAAVADFPSVPELRNPERQAQCLHVIGAALREDTE